MAEHNDVHHKAKLAIAVLVERYKASPESWGLFVALVNLSRTSKAFNNILDNWLALLSCRYIRGGGCHFARLKLAGFIRTSNITKFLDCAAVILQSYHQSVYIHIFTKCLIDIVTKCDYEFLLKYVTYMKDQGVLKAGRQFFVPPPNQGKFPQFKPMELIKALRIANENGWSDKALLLFDHLVDAYTVSTAEQRSRLSSVVPIRERISKNARLNFDGQLANFLGQVWPFWDRYNSRRHQQLKTLLELQPWFCGDSPNTLDSAVCDALVVGFEGSKLIAMIGRKKYDFPQHCRALIESRQVKFYVPNNGVINSVHLYHFYVSLVQQDLETMKSIQNSHKIDWSTVETQPNPFVELLRNATSAPRAEVVQYLLDIGVPRQLAWTAEQPVRDDFLPFVELLLSAGAQLHENLVIQLLQKISFMNAKQMQRLINACAYARVAMTKNIFLFALFKFQAIYHNCFTEQKLTLLEMYKNGNIEDRTNYLQTLPKELLSYVLDLAEEPMLFYQLSAMILRVKSLNTDGVATVDQIRDSPHLVQLIVTESVNQQLKDRTMKYLRCLLPRKIIRREYKWIRQEILAETIMRYKLAGRELSRYIMKHETDPVVFNNFHQFYRKNFAIADHIIEAFKTRNVTALQFCLAHNLLAMPSRQTFEAVMKPPKYTMTYREAEELIDYLRTRKI